MNGEADEALARALFAGGVLATACPISDSDGDLFPEESALVERAVAKRRREFAAGRRAARALLARLGHPRAPLLRGGDRAPAWPPGVVGSISHGADLCVVAVAPSRELAGLGVDVEPDEPLAPRLWPRICTPAELERLPAGAERGRAVRLVFSAKESLYKCIQPLLGAAPGFTGVEIDLDEARAGFAVRFDDAWRARLPGGRLPEGRFLRRHGFVLTAATLPAI